MVHASCIMQSISFRFSMIHCLDHPSNCTHSLNDLGAFNVNHFIDPHAYELAGQSFCYIAEYFESTL